MRLVFECVVHRLILCDCFIVLILNFVGIMSDKEMNGDSRRSLSPRRSPSDRREFRSSRGDYRGRGRGSGYIRGVLRVLVVVLRLI